jgi:hypothetical protein
MTSREKPPAGASFFTASVNGPPTHQQQDGTDEQESSRKQGNNSNSFKKEFSFPAVKVPSNRRRIAGTDQTIPRPRFI